MSLAILIYISNLNFMLSSIIHNRVLGVVPCSNHKSLPAHFLCALNIPILIILTIYFFITLVHGFFFFKCMREQISVHHFFSLFLVNTTIHRTPHPLYIHYIHLFITLLLDSKPFFVLAVLESKMCTCSIARSVSNDHLGSSTDLYYIQNHVVMKHVIKRFR